MRLICEIGGEELLSELLKDTGLSSNESLKKGFTDIGLLFEYLTIFNVMPKVRIQLPEEYYFY